MRLFLKKYCNAKIACSREAGEFLYGKKEFTKNGIILNNGIDTNAYRYSEAARAGKRNELGIDKDAVVLGHIGQLYSVKNQSFIIDIFEEYHKTNPNSVLLLIGEGTDREMLENKVFKKHLEKNILLLGGRKDIPELLSAMDCFVFPSLHEGFPLTLIEAQASQLPCLISDTVTKTTKLNSNVRYCSLNQTAEEWSEEVRNLVALSRSDTDITKVVKLYDIKNIAKELEQIYLN